MESHLKSLTKFISFAATPNVVPQRFLESILFHFGIKQGIELADDARKECDRLANNYPIQHPVFRLGNVKLPLSLLKPREK